MRSNKAFVITAGLPKHLSILAQRSFSNELGFCCCPIVHQTLGFPTGGTTQIIYFLCRENLSVAYHDFEGCFSWMKKGWIPAKGVWVAFGKSLSR